MQLVGGMVCMFIVMCMVGSAVIGFLVDRSKAFKLWLVVCLVGSAASLLWLIWLGPSSLLHIWLSICMLGFWMGPVQPLSIETAVEVTYPAPESSVTAVQQVVANLASSALFPLILLCRNPVTKSMQPALLLMLFALLGTGLFYVTFDGQYRRLQHERDSEVAHRELHRRMHEEAHREQVRAMQKRKTELIDKLNSDAAAASAAEDKDAATAAALSESH